MHKIILIDGCVDDEPGKVLYGVLNHIVGIVGEIQTDKIAGGLDLEGYNIARELVKQSFNSRRNQVNAETLIGNIVSHPFVLRQDPKAKIIVLLPESFYAHHSGRTLSYVHGGLFFYKGRKIVIMSTARFYDNGKFDPMHFGYIITHELGHMFDAVTTKNRSNTFELFGTHCSNDCVMQQEDGNSRVRAQDLGKRGKSFCDQCRTEMMQKHRLR